MFGLAAAPEIASAVPSVMPFDRRIHRSAGNRAIARSYRSTSAVPQCSGVAVNGSALRSCQASRLRRNHVERHVDDVERLPALRALAGRPEPRHADVVELVEAGERVRLALRIGGAEIGADQPVAIERVDRESVDVDADPGKERHHEAVTSRRRSPATTSLRRACSADAFAPSSELSISALSNSMIVDQQRDRRRTSMNEEDRRRDPQAAIIDRQAGSSCRSGRSHRTCRSCRAAC